MITLKSSDLGIHSSPVIISKNPDEIYTGIKKSSCTKTYFLIDENKEHIDLISYPRISEHEKRMKSASKSPPKSIGKGQFGEIFTKFSSNATVVKKKLNKENGAFNKLRLKAFKKLNLNALFREKCLENVCIPFQIEKYPDTLYMKKISGISLEDKKVFEGEIYLTKKQIMELFNIIEILATNFSIVHTNIHAGNIMFSNGKLALIGFDECISKKSTRENVRMVSNPDYIENPSDDDYLGGYDKNIPEKIEDELNVDEEAFYVSDSTFDSELKDSLNKYKKIFQHGDQLLFESKEFNQTPDKDEQKIFTLKINSRKYSSDGSLERDYNEFE